MNVISNLSQFRRQTSPILKQVGFLVAILCAGGADGQIISRAPSFSPQPREVHLAESKGIKSIAVVTPGGDTDDVFAAQNLSEAFAKRGVSVVHGGKGSVTISLLRRGTAKAERLLVEEKLTFDAPMNDEGYVLVSSGGSVTIIAATGAGVSTARRR